MANADEFSDDEGSETNENISELLKSNDEELAKAYLNVAKNWTPWWLDEEFKYSPLIEDSQPDKLKLNLSLIENSANINVSNASQMIYNDILQLDYLYLMIVHVYQLDMNDFVKSTENFDLDLLEEICVNFLNNEKLLKLRLSKVKHLDIKSEFNLIINILLEEKTYF